jgi:hypothetical protein
MAQARLKVMGGEVNISAFHLKNLGYAKSRKAKVMKAGEEAVFLIRNK